MSVWGFSAGGPAGSAVPAALAASAKGASVHLDLERGAAHRKGPTARRPIRGNGNHGSLEPHCLAVPEVIEASKIALGYLPDGDGSWIELPFTFPVPFDEVWMSWHQYYPDGSEGLGTAMYYHRETSQADNNKLLLIDDTAELGSGDFATFGLETYHGNRGSPNQPTMACLLQNAPEIASVRGQAAGIPSSRGPGEFPLTTGDPAVPLPPPGIGGIRSQGTACADLRYSLDSRR